MEPVFAETASNTVTSEVSAQLAAAVAAIPPAHCLNPLEGEPTASKEAALVRLQNWAFTKGFALVTASAKTKNERIVRVHFNCVHHKKETRNTRKFAEEDRKRPHTKTQANSCKFSIIVGHSRELGCWMIRSKNLMHNHAPNPNPFIYHQHRDKTPGYVVAIAAAEVHRGIISYKEHAACSSYAGPGSQHQPFPFSSDSGSDFQSDCEPRRSGHVKKPSRVVESQQWQIDHGLIPTPGAKGKARALNTKKKKNEEISQLQDGFELLE
jgi:hypothetical protein